MGVSKPFRRGLVWYAKVRPEKGAPGFGRGYNVTLDTRDERRAELRRAKLALDVAEGRWKPPEKTLTLDKFVTDYTESYLNANGAAGREARAKAWQSDAHQLANVVAWLKRRPVTRVAAVTHADALAYKEWRVTEPRANDRPPVSVETVKRTIRVAKAAWNWAIARGFAPSPNPWCKIPFPKRERSDPRNLSEFELRKVWAAAPERAAGTFVAMMSVALYAGLRLGEICTLDQAELRWDDGLIRVAPGKDREPRTTIFPPELQAVLTAFKRPFGLVFRRTKRGLAWSREGVDAAIRRIAARAGVDFTLHDLRRTFAGLLAKRGVPTPRIRDYLGHASITTTEGYYLGRNDDADPADAAKLQLNLGPDLGPSPDTRGATGA